MKKGFYVVMVLCLFGTIAYAIDADDIPKVFEKMPISKSKEKQWQKILSDILQKQSKTESKNEKAKASEVVLKRQNKIAKIEEDLEKSEVNNGNTKTKLNTRLEKHKNKLTKELEYQSLL